MSLLVNSDEDWATWQLVFLAFQWVFNPTCSHFKIKPRAGRIFICDMNKIKNLKASWLFLQLENNADFVMFFLFYLCNISQRNKINQKEQKEFVKLYA